MTTPIWITGWEHGYGWAGYSSISNSSGVTAFGPYSNIAHGGDYCLRLNYSASPTRIGYSVPSSLHVMVGSFYVRPDNNPSYATSDYALFGFLVDAGTGPTIYFNHTTSKLYATNGSDCSVAMTYPDSNWHRVDFKFDFTTNPCTLDFQVDGVAATQSTINQAGAHFTEVDFGGTGPLYIVSFFDDFILSSTSGDYPIGPHKVVGLKPNAEGTHNNTTNTMEDYSGNDIDGSTYTAYDKLDEIPWITTLNDWIKQSTTGTARYCEVQFTDMASGIGDTDIIGVEADLQYTSDAAGGNQGGCIIRDSNGQESEVYGNPTTRQDYSIPTIYNNEKFAVVTAPTGGGWTKTHVNALRCRFGYSNDVSPSPKWMAVLLEAAYKVYPTPFITKLYDVVPTLSGTSVSSSKSAYLKGLSTTSGSKSAYLRGGIIATPSLKSAYLKGGTGVLSSKSAYLKGKADSVTSKSAYLKGSSSAVNSKSAYLKGKVLTSSSKYAYLRGGILTSSSKYAYLRGGVVSTSSKSAYLKGQASTTSSKFAYIKGQTSTTSSKFAYLKGSTNVVSSKTAYLRGGVTSTTSKYAFLRGKNTSITNKSAYTKGSSLTTTSKAAYLKGQSAGLSSKTAYLKGLSTGVSSKHAYLTGGLLISSSKGVYLFGDVTEPLTPDADVSVNGWINEVGGGTLFPSVADALDTNYATYNSPTGGEYFEVSLSTPEGDPDNSNDHIIVWRAGKLSADGTVIMKVQLRMGGSLIAEYSHLITQSYQTFEDSLSQAEIDSITDYTTLSLRFYVVSVA